MNAFQCRTHRLTAHLRELFHNGPNYRLRLSSLNSHSATLPVEAEITASTSLPSRIETLIPVIAVVRRSAHFQIDQCVTDVRVFDDISVYPCWGRNVSFGT